MSDAMKRRRVLKLIGGAGIAGYAGCLGAPTVQTDSQTTSSEKKTQTERDTREVIIANQDTMADEHNLRIEATMLEPTVTEAHPARLRITITNDHERRTTFYHGCSAFSKYDWMSNPYGLFLANAESPSWALESGPQWIIEPPSEPGTEGYFGDAACGASPYKPGQSRRFERVLYDDGRIEGYLEPGTYGFTDTFLLTSSLDAERSREDSVRVDWWMDLRIENPT